jgi:glycerophosphoryl diester phosphodiesterase
LREAEALGVGAIEADVHRYRGRLEVRHLKTLGPVPILWDRWRLANPFAPRLLVTDLLAASSPGELVFDLKGRDRRLAEELVAALAARLARGWPTTVCARHWPLLEAFAGVPGVRLVHSVGSARGLRRLRRRLGTRRIQGITIHERLLDSRAVTDLRSHADTIMTWPVNTLERAQELARWGVDGLISDRPGLIKSGIGADV